MSAAEQVRESWPELNPPKSKADKVVPWSNTTSFLNTPFIVGTTSLQVLQANRSRNYLLIQNKSASNMWVVFNNAATSFAGVLVEAGGNYEPYVAPYSGVYIIGAAAALEGVCIEGVRT